MLFWGLSAMRKLPAHGSSLPHPNSSHLVQAKPKLAPLPMGEGKPAGRGEGVPPTPPAFARVILGPVRHEEAAGTRLEQEEVMAQLRAMHVQDADHHNARTWTLIYNAGPEVDALLKRRAGARQASHNPPSSSPLGQPLAGC